MNNYTATIKTKLPGDQVYAVITEHMSDWWTPMSAQFLNLGDRARTDFGGRSYWELEAIRLDRPHVIELRCSEAYHTHEGLPDSIQEEWLDTVLRFDIRDANDETEITLTHVGLTPQLTCFDVCKAGWDHYFVGSLSSYLKQQLQEKVS